MELIIGSLFSLIAAVIGGVLTGLYTREATRTAHKNALELQREQQRETVAGVLSGIRTEIGTVWELYSRRIGPILERLPQGQTFEHYFPVQSDYFTVYTANCSLIGQITDDSLRKLIISTYMGGKAVVDTHRFNSELIQLLIELSNLAEVHQSPALLERARAVRQMMVLYSEGIRAGYAELRDGVRNLLEALPSASHPHLDNLVE